jgi:two-component system sensor histidine kinase and response regulator WspE
MNNEQDFSLLTLFQSEVAIHTAVLKDGLQVLQNDPSAIERLEAMMQGVHAIWGGARIVALEAVEKIAQAMKDCFSSVQNGKVSLTATHISTLFNGIEILIQIAEAADETTWFTEHQEEIDHAITNITEISSSISPTLSKKVNQTQVNTKSPSKPTMPTQQTTAKNDTKIVVDSSLLELFLIEVETNVAILNDGLLALEDDPGAAEKLEALMRSAHSIKGAARVVGLDVAIKLAHVMEDCFVAAQKGEFSPTSTHIDILLQGVDMLTRISEVAKSGDTLLLTELRENVEQLVTALSTILTGGAVTQPLSPQNTAKPTVKSQITSDSVTKVNPSPKELMDKEPSFDSVDSKESPKKWVDSKATIESKQPLKKMMDNDRMVRVSTSKVERLMGLAGEIVVGARWFPPFSDSLVKLKRSHVELSSILEKLQEILEQDEEKNKRILKLIGSAREKTKECNSCLAERLTELEQFTSISSSHADRLYHEVIGVRMRPFADGIHGYPRMVRDLAKELGKKVKLEIIGKSTEVDQDIQEKLDAPLNHLLRNAIDHGIETPEKRLAVKKPETGSLRLEVGHRSGMLMITVVDDGRGIDLEYLRQRILQKGLVNADMVNKLTEAELMDFLFLPGFSTANNVTEISGRGVGLDVVHSMVHEVGGVIRAVSTPGKGLSFHLELPLTLSVVRMFLVEIAGEPYAFPLARIDRCLVLPKTEIDIVEDRQYFRFGDNNISLVNIHDVLEIEESAHQQHELVVVVVSDRFNSYGLVVNKFLGERDLVVRPLDPRLGKIPDFSAVAVMLDGSPVLIFDVEDLVHSIDNLLSGKRLRKITGATDETEKQKRILVVDDSITVREMERKLLENQGYQVEIAVDGMDGWNAVRTSDFDMVVSDVDMPRMNGFELITHLKQHEDLKSLPVIVVSYKDREEDRVRGLEVGANYYLTKSSFEDNSFIHAVVDLIGEP